MTMCIFIGYPQGYKGWKFYNPLTRQVLISECADFDECFFMNQKYSAPYLPVSRPETLLESPSLQTHLPILLDSTLDDCEELERSQQPVHGGDGSTAADQTSVHSESPQSTYLSLPVPSASPPAHSSPPHTPPIAPAPLAPPSRHQHTRRPRSEWFSEQWAVPQRYTQIREPTPAIPSSDEENDSSDDPIDLIHARLASTVEPTTYKQSQ
jgi:hypothetical protein